MKNQRQVSAFIGSRALMIGDPDAPVLLTEFGDYESVACAQANEIINQLLITYAGKIKYTFRHFPLMKIHQHAHKAAEAAIAAAQEGKFWEMHQILFQNRRNLGLISLKSYAKEIGVKNKNFLNDLINGVYAWNVQDDLKDGIDAGVREVPTFFFNGEKWDQEPTLENFNSKILLLLNHSG
ncbi:MAG TPA: thioredoxin domain-containing protein [Flavisolibacter sp.]|nr:thioredoxin domain-containing protein [Flavisolibacter sp.]